MDIKEEHICRLCLKLVEKDFEIIDEAIRDTFKVLLLTVNFDISRDPIVCNDCRSTSMKCLDFKSVCSVTEESVHSFAANQNRATFALKDVLDDGQDVEMVDDNLICRFCLNRLSGGDFVLLDTLMNDVAFADKLKALLPGMDFDVIKNPVTCLPCSQDSVCYVKFADKCLDVEEKVTDYYRNVDIPSCAQIKLSDVLQFWCKDTFEIDNSQILVKEEKNILENLVELNDSELFKVEEDMNIKEDEVNFDESSCETPRDMSCESKSQNASSQSSSRILPTTNCGTCLCTTIHRCGMKFDEPSNTISSVTGYKGAINKKNRSLNTDNVSEATIFKCALCTYETNRKNSLKQHTLIHKNINEVEMHKCTICTYQTKCKGNLKRHMLTHTDITQVKMHKCSTCAFETKHKYSLKIHTLIHRNVTDEEMYKCSTCTYKTNHKGSLKCHVLIHKDATEVEMYKCSMCTYVTKRKDSLKVHTLTHKDVTEVETYKCSKCTFRTKRKSGLKCHMLTHKDVKEVEMYECSMCAYVSNQKSNLKYHVLIHKDITEVEIYRCPMCSYVTKQKRNLKSHTLIHRDVTEVEMHKCSMCSFASKQKRNLKSHMLIHEIHCRAGNI